MGISNMSDIFLGISDSLNQYSIESKIFGYLNNNHTIGELIQFEVETDIRSLIEAIMTAAKQIGTLNYLGVNEEGLIVFKIPSTIIRTGEYQYVAITDNDSGTMLCSIIGQAFRFTYGCKGRATKTSEQLKALILKQFRSVK